MPSWVVSVYLSLFCIDSVVHSLTTFQTAVISLPYMYVPYSFYQLLTSPFCIIATKYLQNASDITISWVASLSYVKNQVSVLRYSEQSSLMQLLRLSFLLKLCNTLNNSSLITHMWCCVSGNYPPPPAKYTSDLRSLIAELFRRNPRYDYSYNFNFGNCRSEIIN